MRDRDRRSIVSHAESIDHFQTIQALYATQGGSYDWINDMLTALVRHCYRFVSR